MSALLFLLSWAAPVDVVRVIDGDTVVIRHQGRVERVRFRSIDTPELRDPQARLRKKAWRARALVKRLLEEADGVQLVVKGDRTRDRYGRLLGELYVHRKGKWIGISAELLRKKLARRWVKVWRRGKKKW